MHLVIDFGAVIDGYQQDNVKVLSRYYNGYWIIFKTCPTLWHLWRAQCAWVVSKPYFPLARTFKTLFLDLHAEATLSSRLLCVQAQLIIKQENKFQEQDK